MTPTQFLQAWKADYIDSRTNQSQAPTLVATLLVDAESKGINRDELAAAAGGGLVTYIMNAIRDVTQEEPKPAEDLR